MHFTSICDETKHHVMRMSNTTKTRGTVLHFQFNFQFLLFLLDNLRMMGRHKIASERQAFNGNGEHGTGIRVRTLRMGMEWHFCFTYLRCGPYRMDLYTIFPFSTLPVPRDSFDLIPPFSLHLSSCLQPILAAAEARGSCLYDMRRMDGWICSYA
jgi:hypothetical protein